MNGTSVRREALFGAMKYRLSAAFAVLPLLLAASDAYARPDISAAFGNTIQSTYPDGRQAEVWLEPGGAYRSTGRQGQDTGGVWRMRGNRLCLNQRRPFVAPFAYCTEIPDRTDSEWSARAPTGEHIRVRLMHGHVRGRKGPAPR